MKYRKKPVIIEAEQFHRGISLVNTQKGVCQCERGSFRGHLHTIHNGQVVDLEDGDWIIPEPDGVHFYPVKPDIFNATYEKVEE
jgi:hypothetical protein